MEAEQTALQTGETQFSKNHSAAATRMLLMLALCVVLALAVARFSIVRAEELEKATQRHYAEVQQLSARLLEVEEEDRKRLSRELHDEIGQALAVLQMEISSAGGALAGKEPEARERLARARSLVEKTVQTVRDITLLLRPALLDDLGLAPALEWLTEDFARRSGIRCEFSEVAVHDRLPEGVKTCVYRIVQEALHNCEKHAGASAARVEVQCTEKAISILVGDNGRGFEAGAKTTTGSLAGLGIVGMRERAARMGGTITIESSPGRGTRVSAIIPLARGAHDPGLRSARVAASL